jgi:hypothetical protein
MKLFDYKKKEDYGMEHVFTLLKGKRRSFIQVSFDWNDYNIPEPRDDAPWLNLTPQEVEELRYNKQELTKYGREKIRALMLKSQMTEDIQQPNGDFLKNYPDVTRVEVIGNDGREFVHYGCSNVKVSLQDDGRTIKVFLYTMFQQKENDCPGTMVEQTPKTNWLRLFFVLHRRM